MSPDYICKDIMEHLACYVKFSDKMTLIGYCMGGKICMKLASMYPDIFDEIILLESIVGPTNYPPADFILE